MVPRVKENNPLSTLKMLLDFDEVLHILYEYSLSIDKY